MAYFIELTSALECQKQLLMSSISNLGGRESLKIAVTTKSKKNNCLLKTKNMHTTRSSRVRVLTYVNICMILQRHDLF